MADRQAGRIDGLVKRFIFVGFVLDLLDDEDSFGSFVDGDDSGGCGCHF